jgi:PTS system galactitol-specific IIA component
MRNVAVRQRAELDLVACTSDAADPETLLGEVGAWLTDHGYTREGFTDALTARERDHPTGLLTAGGGVALPHAEPELVARPALVVCRPETAVVFRRMDAPGRSVEVELVLVLVIAAPDRHMELLSGLAGVLGDGDRVRALAAPLEPEAMLEVAAGQLAGTLPGAP